MFNSPQIYHFRIGKPDRNLFPSPSEGSIGIASDFRGRALWTRFLERASFPTRFLPAQRGKILLACDDVQQLSGNVDDLADRFSFQMLADSGAGEGGGFDRFLVGVF